MDSISVGTAVLIVSVGVFAVVSLLVGIASLVIGYHVLSALKPLVSHANNFMARLECIENYLSDLSKDVEDNGSPTAIYRSMDGKFAADSFEELVDKMANDPDTPLNTSDKDQLQQMFGEHQIEEDDEDDEPWRKRK